MPQPLPSRVRDLRVPNPERRYFAGGAAHPFEPAARRYSAVNAWWLAELSFAAYLREREDCAERMLAAGWESVRMIEKKGTRCVVGRWRDATVACFRGTDRAEPRNVFTDLAFKLGEWPGAGRVHSGFRAALDQVWPRLVEELENARPDRLWFTGHSLGGALATLAAARLDRVDARVYVYGAPRVGDEDFAAAYRVPTHRFINGRDIVAFLPPAVKYRHVGDPVHLEGVDSVRFIEPRYELDPRRFAEAIRAAADLRDAFRGLTLASAVADHYPIHYAVRLWNALESSNP